MTNPALFAEDPLRKEFAKAIVNAPPPPRQEPVRYRQWGEGLEEEAVNQTDKACLLPVSVAGALMPDAHVGYGLPIGGVLATENAVIPFAVGVDIACRMKMTVLDLPLRDLDRKQDRLARAIEAETRFGVGATFIDRRQHEVLEADWNTSPVTRQNRDRAWAQLGTSGSGKGNPESLNSASHGAGRVMSRTAAMQKFNWKDVKRLLRERGVTLLSAGLDEVPMVYKNIHEVMAAQRDLVTVLGQFDPKLVKMAPHGERAEEQNPAILSLERSQSRPPAWG